VWIANADVNIHPHVHPKDEERKRLERLSSNFSVATAEKRVTGANLALFQLAFAKPERER
jgi:hypothetical protein